MAQSVLRNGLQIGQDEDFERRTLKIEQMGWLLMGLIVLGALLGLFGTGLFSKTETGAGDPLRVQYHRFLRSQAPTEVRVRLGTGAVQGGEVRLWLSGRYLANVVIERIEPEPEKVELRSDGQVYSFAAAELDAPATVTFRLSAQRAGRLPGSLKLDGGSLYSFSQFVYP